MRVIASYTLPQRGERGLSPVPQPWDYVPGNLPQYRKLFRDAGPGELEVGDAFGAVGGDMLREGVDG